MKIPLHEGLLDSPVKFRLVESKNDPLVDGKFILGKVVGEFFVPDGVSRNKRFYPASLWEKAIANANVQQKIKDRLMFGTIGHDGEIGEKALREGMVSHFMSKIWIENGKGMGEAYILNTEAGRNLFILLSAGCNLRTSSRANGMFRGERDGMPVVDEDNYDLEGWDFVLEAGFLEANPKLRESLNDLGLQNTKNNGTLLITDKIGESRMSEKTIETTLVQHVVDENAELKKKLGTLTEELDAVKADKDVADKKLAELEADDEEVSEKLKRLAKYEELGTPEEIEAEQKVAEEEKEELEKFKELGDSPEEVEESLVLARKHLKGIKESFGTVPEIRRALTEGVAFRKAVDAIGTLSEIKESLSAFKTIVEEEEAEQEEKELQELADEVELDKEEVKEMLKVSSAAQIRTLHAKISEKFSKTPSTSKKPVEESRFAKTAPRVIVEGKDKKTDKKDSSVNEDSYKGGSRLDRLNERLGM